MAIDHYDGHMSEIARRLGIGRSTLYRKLRELGLDQTESVHELEEERVREAV
jgi:DNA-binding NtrC family response regulator